MVSVLAAPASGALKILVVKEQQPASPEGLISSVSPTGWWLLMLLAMPLHDHQMIGHHMSAADSPVAARLLQAIKTIIMIWVVPSLLSHFDLEDNVCMHKYGKLDLQVLSVGTIRIL